MIGFFSSKNACSSMIRRTTPMSRPHHTSEKPTQVFQKIVTKKLEIPTYEQVKNSPYLQKELAKMYEAQAKDPDFQQLTRESTAIGLESLKNSKP